MAKLIRLLLVCLFVTALVAWAAVLLGLRSYRVFTAEELVAVVECKSPPKGSGYDFQLNVIQAFNSREGGSEIFLMRGDQWMISGDFLKWHPWLNLVGFKNCHKLSRLSGRYIKTESEIHKPRSVYDLQGGTSRLWRFLYDAQQFVPFIEAVYGNGAYTMAYQGGTWGVYATLSGYMVRRIKTIQR